MKRCLILVFVSALLLSSGLLTSCGTVTTTDDTTVERDKAVIFYKGAYPIGEERKQVINEWNILS